METLAPFKSGRRIDELKAIAESCGLTKDQARIFGDLRSTATWEKLLLAHGLEFDRNVTQPRDTASPTSTQINPINFFEWVDLSQLLAVTLASAGVILLLMSLWPRALNSIPRPVHFKIEFTISGDK